MQSRDESGNVKQLTEVDPSKFDDLFKKIASAEKKGATHHVIAKLPREGGNIEINGMSYRVEFADFVKGKYRMKLVLRDK